MEYEEKWCNNCHGSISGLPDSCPHCGAKFSGISEASSDALAEHHERICKEIDWHGLLCLLGICALVLIPAILMIVASWILYQIQSSPAWVVLLGIAVALICVETVAFIDTFRFYRKIRALLTIVLVFTICTIAVIYNWPDKPPVNSQSGLSFWPYLKWAIPTIIVIYLIPFILLAFSHTRNIYYRSVSYKRQQEGDRITTKELVQVLKQERIICESDKVVTEMFKRCFLSNYKTAVFWKECLTIARKEGRVNELGEHILTLEHIHKASHNAHFFYG